MSVRPASARSAWVGAGARTRWRGAAPTAVVVAAAAPLLLTPGTIDDVARVAATDAIFALAYVVVLGLAGQFSLAHAALFGVGAYAAAILTTRAGIDPLLALPVAVAAGALAGIVVGLPALRVRGDQLAVLTLAVGVGAQMLFLNWTSVTGGFSGIPAIPSPSVAGRLLADDRSLYILALAVLALAIAGVEALRHSRAGRAMRAVQADELQARTLGINVGLTKVLAFAISGGIAAAGGWVYAESVGYVSSAAFGLTVAVLGVVMVLVAGPGRVYAAIIAGAALAVLNTLTEHVPAVELAVLGVAMLTAVLWRGRAGRAESLV